MIPIVIGLALVAQILSPVRAYTMDDPTISGVRLNDVLEPALDLVTPDGAFVIGLGQGCDEIGPGQNVEVVYGSHDLATINTIGSEQLCQIVFALQISDTPCATNADGFCDVEAR